MDTIQPVHFFFSLNNIIFKISCQHYDEILHKMLDLVPLETAGDLATVARL